jgi:hypothetical protein
MNRDTRIDKPRVLMFKRGAKETFHLLKDAITWISFLAKCNAL